MNSPVAPPAPTPLQHLQTQFAIADINGELRVVDLEQLQSIKAGITSASLGFYSRADGATKMTRALEQLPQPSTPRTVIDQFWKAPATTVFDRIAFTPLLTGPSTINLWAPPTMQAVQGRSSRLIRRFIRKAISAGDRQLYKYILRFLAHMLQKPHVKPGIVIVLLGGQGTGKGTFLRILQRIWGRTTLVVSDVNQIVGTFNASLERNYVICMDEALFAGDKKSMERLKSLVTEPVIHIEQKYQPSHSIESFHRFFATSNNDHFGQVDSDDRRFVFVRVSDAHKADSGYFDALHAAIEDDATLGAFVHDLMSMNLSAYNPRQRPITNEHGRQKLQSLSGFDRYWYERLCLGKPPLQCEFTVWQVGFHTSSGMQSGFKEHDPQASRYRPFQNDHLADRLRKICPSAQPGRKSINGIKQRGYGLPTLAVARSEFETYIGSKIDWDPAEIPDDPPEVGPPAHHQTTAAGQIIAQFQGRIPAKTIAGPLRPSVS